MPGGSNCLNGSNEKARPNGLDGEAFRELVFSAQEHLSLHKKEIDALNVFPVPDGDTGTNMSLTLSSAAESLRRCEDLTLSQAAEMASMGALMGARGNSGVILSQIFRGITRAFSGLKVASVHDVARALDEAVSTAYKAVMKPVEGTMLTVLRAMRDAAVEASAKTDDLAQVLHASLVRAREVLAKTPEMLPVLKQAGVVDAGGKGLTLILEGMVDYLSGKGLSVAAGTASLEKPLLQAGPLSEAADITEQDILDISNPYDTQFLLVGQGMPLPVIREKLESMGDSVLVVGSESLVRVHIHTKSPGEVLTYCLRYGALSEVTIDNMIEQSRKAMKERAGQKLAVGESPRALSGTVSGAGSDSVRIRMPEIDPTSPNDAPKIQPSAPAKETGIVSVASGEGLTEIMKSLGCDLVIDGGATMNPSTSDLLSAVKTVNARKIIFLPNNGNIFLTAKQAKKLAGRNMYIVPSRTIPQGISALLSLNLNEDMEHNLKRAAKAVKGVRTGEVTFAARNGKFGRHVMKAGDILGLVDGKVEAVGNNPEEILKKIVKTMVNRDDAVVTIYYGHDRSEASVQAVVAQIREEIGVDLEVELHNGGQPLYYYIVSVE